MSFAVLFAFSCKLQSDDSAVGVVVLIKRLLRFWRKGESYASIFLLICSCSKQFPFTRQLEFADSTIMLDAMLLDCADFYFLRFKEANQCHPSPIAFQGESVEGGDAGCVSLFKQVVISLDCISKRLLLFLSCRRCSSTSLTRNMSWSDNLDVRRPDLKQFNVILRDGTQLSSLSILLKQYKLTIMEHKFFHLKSLSYTNDNNSSGIRNKKEGGNTMLN